MQATYEYYYVKTSGAVQLGRIEGGYVPPTEQVPRYRSVGPHSQCIARGDFRFVGLRN